jgi:uncharacterized membrane protein (DUF4010 family)
MRSIIIFAALSGVILPLIPKTDLLYGYVNLFQAWLMIVLIAGISLLSYMLIKLLGASKGLFLSGFLGGLISSTAVTLSFAALSKSSPRHKWSFVTGICSCVFRSVTCKQYSWMESVSITDCIEYCWDFDCCVDGVDS